MSPHYGHIYAIIGPHHLINSRYDQLNNKLEIISKKQNLDDGDKRILIDYFNLCSEEFMWLLRGRIPKDIWMSWLNGIKINLQIPIIHAFYLEEKSK